MGSNLLSLPNSSSTSSTSQRKYAVFLSFRGEDTRYKFTDHLYTALVKRGIVTFIDNENLERGKVISPELLQAIEDSRFAIVILSENYATSSWCLDELAKIIECEKELGMTVLPVFHYVDPSDVRKQTGTFEEAFDAHKKLYEEKRVQTWRDALIHVGNLAGCHLKNISPETQEIQRIVRQISRTVRYKFSELTKDLVGIYPQARELESLLAVDQFDDVQFIGVWAMGGMGKTTLAQFVYDKVLEEFEGSCFISDVAGVFEKHGLRELQKKLILKLLNESNLDCDDDHDLSIKNMTRFRHKRILLVLDGVGGPDQLKELAREHDWFGRGSRIIIITRDKHLLEGHSVDKIYEIKPMGYEDALHLFCLKAFKKKYIADEYSKLSSEFLYYADGLPLALEVLGSFLFGKSTDEWKSALERLKGDPVRDVIKVLQISFDGLNHSEKEIFLYIACLFNHENKDYVVEILHVLDLHPDIGLRELIDKSLLKISNNNELWMHNLLGEMGRHIVRQESHDEPGKHSILWRYKDIDHVLKTNTGTEKVQAIDIRGAKETGICHEDKEVCWRPQGSDLLVKLQRWVLSSLSWRGLALLVTLQGWVQRTLSWQGFTSSKKQKGPLWNPNAFLKMPNLKFLRVNNVNLLHVPTQLSNNLRFIEWSDYPAKFLPYFQPNEQPNELVQLRLPWSEIVILWEGKKNFDKLKFIDLAGSSNLIIGPDFTGVPNLEKLVLAWCSNLLQLHPSIGNMKKLILLDLKRCKELSCLPDKFEMESLEILDLSYCSKVKKVPEFVGDMKRLQKLLLECTAITELPSSVECLTGLNILILGGCKNLRCLPNTICSLTLIKHLDLYKCSKLDKLPECLGNIVSLKELNLSGTAIKELPSSVESMIGLISLNLNDCKNFVFLPSTICSLKSLFQIYLCGCSKFVNLPDNLGNLEGLKMLFLRGTAIEMLPSSVGSLTALCSLEIRDCKNLKYLPNTICSLKNLDVLNLSGCSKIVNLPKDLANLEGLGMLCLERTAIEMLPSSIGSLTALRSLKLKDCKNLKCLPNIICSLFNLCDLDLSGCSKIVYLPKDLGKMKRLSILHLNGISIKNEVCFRECQWPSFSSDLVLMLLHCCIRVKELDLRDCRLLAIPNNIGCLYDLVTLRLSGNDFVSLPESISHLFNLKKLYLDGCKGLRSLPSLPSKVEYISVNNCTSLERWPGTKNIFRPHHFSVCFDCINCFKLADNIQSGFNTLQGQSGKLLARRLPSLIPGSEIPSWLKEVKICEEPCGSFCSSHSFRIYSSHNPNMNRILKMKKVNIQVPFNGCDELEGILLCLVFVPRERHRYPSEINVNSIEVDGRRWILLPHRDSIGESYCKFESHHLWLVYLQKAHLSFLKSPCSFIEIKIASVSMEVEKIGFGLVYEGEFEQASSNRSEVERIRRQYLLL